MLQREFERVLKKSGGRPWDPVPFCNGVLPDLHTDFSRGRPGGLVFPSLSEFSTVSCDPHSQRFWLVNKAEIDVFFWNSLAFSMIQWMLAI